jgi:chitinase
MKLFLGVIFLIYFTHRVSYAQVTKKDHNDYNTNPYRLVCYFGSWANYHKVDPFKIEDIDPHLCTHLNYGFAKINEYSYKIEIFDPYLDGDENPWDLQAYDRFNNLRQQNPQLTTFISLGGWYEGSEKYSDMAKDAALRHEFVQSVIEFLNHWKFDGLDLDWEYPGNRGGDKKVDKDNYILLLRELRAEFDKHGFLLTAAVSAGKPTMDKAYDDIPALNELLDFYNVMTYDYHGGWENHTGHSSPLYHRPDEADHPLNSIFNVNYTINYWLSLGADKKKMVMGMPFYGRAWTINVTNPGLNVTTVDMSPPGFISGEYGVLGYNEFCEMYKNHTADWTIVYDGYYKAPYAYNKTLFLGFENVRSIACKVSYLKKMGLSGGMVWSLETDDFKGHCGDKYILLHKVHAMLNGAEKSSFQCDIDFPETVTTPAPTTPAPTTPSPTTPSPTTQSPTTPTPAPTTPSPTSPPTPSPTQPPTTTPAPTTSLNPYIINCVHQGMFAHPSDPHKYVVCEYENGQWWIFVKDCAPGTRWHQNLLTCLAEENP